MKDLNHNLLGLPAIEDLELIKRIGVVADGSGGSSIGEQTSSKA